MKFWCVAAFRPLVLLIDLEFPFQFGHERLSYLYVRQVIFFTDNCVTSENPKGLTSMDTRVNDSVVVVICVENIVVGIAAQKSTCLIDVAGATIRAAHVVDFGLSVAEIFVLI